MACVRSTAPRSTAALLASLLAACTATPPGEPAPAAQAVTVTVSPDTAVVAPGAGQAFAAAVTGSAVTTVTWSVREGAPGGSVSSGGLYTAPSAAGSYHVVATSDADPAVSGAATVTVTAPAVVTVAVTPATLTLAARGTATFAATVVGSADGAVTWSVREAACGSITAGGLYTAPAAAATCHVVATSHADPSKTATATVTVTAPPAAVAVTITPGTATVNACQTLTLSATVTGSSNTSITWSVAEAAGGAVSGGVYTAPSAAGTYHVVATSNADPTKSATATLSVVDKILSVAVSPATLSLAPGATGQFTATVTTTCGSVTALRTVTAPVN